MEHRLRLSKNVVVVTESIDEAAKFLYRNMELKLGVKKERKVIDAIREYIDMAKESNQHYAILEKLANNYLPNGDGFNNGTEIDVENSTKDRIILSSAYHHMDDYGIYCDWSHFKVIVTFEEDGTFNILGIDTIIYGNADRSMRDLDIEYWAEVFTYALDVELKGRGKDDEKDIRV